MDGTPTKYYFSCALDRRFPCADTPSSSQSTSTGDAVDPISPDDSVSVVNAPIRRVAEAPASPARGQYRADGVQ